MKKLLTTFLAAALCTALSAQICISDLEVDPLLAADVLRPYPVAEVSSPAGAPEGYRPFFLYYFGRHGSRYHTDGKIYTRTLEFFRQAESDGALTEEGKSLLDKLEVIASDAAGRTGELTMLGASQAEGIAQRMYDNFPELFSTRGARINSVSTQVHRVILTMASFNNRLKVLNPGLEIQQRASYGYPAEGEFGVDVEGEKEIFSHDYELFHRLTDYEKTIEWGGITIQKLFGDKDYVSAHGQSWGGLRSDLWQLACITENSDLPEGCSMLDLFSPKEMFHMWEHSNYCLYYRSGAFSGTSDIIGRRSGPVIRSIISNADAALAGNIPSAALRFAHDTNITPLLAAMGLEGCYANVSDPSEVAGVWSDSRISPMAANLQLIFFKNDSGDTIVLSRLNENDRLFPELQSDIAPFYHWDSLKEYLESRTK